MWKRERNKAASLRRVSPAQQNISAPRVRWQGILFVHSCSLLLATFISVFRDLHHPCCPCHLTKHKLFPITGGCRHCCLWSVAQGVNSTSEYFQTPGAPGGGASHGSAWNVMPRTVLYSQTVLWAGNNTHTHTNVPVCCSCMTSSLPPIGFVLHLYLYLLRCFHIPWRCFFKPPLPQNHFMSACCLFWTASVWPVSFLHAFIYLKALSMTLQVWNLLVTILKIPLSWHFGASSCCLSSLSPRLSYIINSSTSHYI